MRVRAWRATASSAQRATNPAMANTKNRRKACQPSASTTASTIHVSGKTAAPTSIRTVPLVTGTRTRRDARRTIRYGTMLAASPNTMNGENTTASTTTAIALRTRASRPGPGVISASVR